MSVLQRSGSLHGRKILASVSALHPVNGKADEFRVAYMGDTSADSNLIVIFAASLCAFACALGLISMVRWALHCNRRIGTQSADNVAIQLATIGLKKRVRRALPFIVYGKGCGFAEAGADCPICLAEFVQGEDVSVLPECHHSFHVGCIDTWLSDHSSCPTCRRCLVDTVCRTAVSGNLESLEGLPAVPGGTSPLPSSSEADLQVGHSGRPS